MVSILIEDYEISILLIEGFQSPFEEKVVSIKLAQEQLKAQKAAFQSPFEEKVVSIWRYGFNVVLSTNRFQSPFEEKVVFITCAMISP